MSDFIVQLSQISKHFGKQTIIDDINLEVKNGEFLTLLGPSGCGKTTLLRIISGSEVPDTGKIVLNGLDVTDLQPEERQVHRVFQNYALFPHMTVFENVAFGLECKNIPKAEIRQRVTEILATVKLEEFIYHKPSQLSGGQQQRVAIARAAVNRPLVLLLDEPLSALDYSLRKKMQIELKELQRTLNITFILVTHDQEEALSMSDRIVVMNKGKIAQIGSPRDIYENPINRYVANFIGNANMLSTVVTHTKEKTLSCTIEGKVFQFENKHHYQVNQKIVIVMRPEDIQVYPTHKLNEEIRDHALSGSIHEVIYKGSTIDLIIDMPSGKQLTITEFFNEDDQTTEYKKEETIWIHWPLGWEVILDDNE